MKLRQLGQSPQPAERQPEAVTEAPSPIGRTGTAVKDGVVQSLRGIKEIEAETVTLVRGTVSDAVRATGALAGDVIAVSRDVAAMARDAASVIEAAQETGGDVGALTGAAVAGAVQAAEREERCRRPAAAAQGGAGTPAGASEGERGRAR